jgi:large subunit ribosomal protein L7/L12
MMSIALDDKTQKIFDEIKSLTFLQTANLVKAFEDEFGISAAAPVAVAAAPAAAAAEAVEEQSEFTVILAEVPADKKIAVLKEVRAITGLGLKEAKDLVDAPPKPLKENVKKEEAQAMQKQLEAAGAKVELK